MSSDHVPSIEHRSAGDKTTWTLAQSRRADHRERIARRQPREAIVRQQAQLVASRSQTAGYRERARARGARGGWALRAADIDPRQVRGVCGPRGIEADPVGGARRRYAAPGCGDRAARCDARWGNAEARSAAPGDREGVARRQARVAVVRQETQL